MDGSDCGQEVREGNRVSDEGGDWGGGEGRGVGLDGMVFADRE